MASGRAYAHPRWNANAEGPAKKEVGYSSAMLADGTTAVRSVPRGIRHFPPATTAIKEYTISYVFESGLIFGRLPLCVIFDRDEADRRSGHVGCSPEAKMKSAYWHLSRQS